MDEVSEFFKKGFLDLRKKAIEKNYQQKTLNDRRNNFSSLRRVTRNNLICQKRQIDEYMSPINTPENPKRNSRTQKITKNEDVKQVNTRLEKLHKWKMEREKRKQEEKRKAKPLFKVCHVPVDVGLPNLENVNREIKGKPIKTNVLSSKSQFAPPNHKFKPPKNIKPIHLNTDKSQIASAKVKDTKSSEKMRHVTKMASDISQIKDKRNLKCGSVQNLTSSNSEKKNVLRGTKYDTKIEKKVVNRTEKNSPSTELPTKQNVNKGAIPKIISNTKNNVGKKHKSETATADGGKECKSLSTKRTSRKGKSTDTKSNSVKHPNKKSVNFEWTEVEFVENDDLFVENKTYKTPETSTKKYRRTPRKAPNFSSSEEDLKIDDVLVLPEDAGKSSESTKPGVSVGSATGSASPDYPMDNEISENFHTPVKNNPQQESPVYISPFVTVSRGKDSARKEYQMRRSTGDNVTPDLGIDISNNISPKAGAEYFTKKLNNEIKRLESMCETWDKYRNTNEVTEEANDMIDVAIGQSKLLISKKFEQFRSLISQCKKCEYLEKPVTCEDLHGFWDMVYMQVEDLNKRFNNLTELKNNNWQEIVPEKKVVVKRGRGRPKKATANAGLKNLIKSARNIKKSYTQNVGQSQALDPQAVETKTFSGGYYSVNTPVKDEEKINASSSRRSLRVSLLPNQNKLRHSSSPYTLMKISQAIKSGDGITPSKSILKSDQTKSEKRITKQVLFKDDFRKSFGNKNKSKDSKRDVVNKENDLNQINLISFSPATPRRSKRLSKMN